jgi:rhodanese-related sulfurtransferase
VSGADLVRALAQRTGLVVVDVRPAASHAASGVQAKGALRASPEDILQVCGDLPRTRGMVTYCDAPDEALSVRAARQLMGKGFTRVAVLSGGFAAWLAAGLPLEHAPHGTATPPQPPRAALEGPAASAPSALTAQTLVDLPVGVKGTGPYFNARAAALGMTGLTLLSPRPLAVGQQLRLTLFLVGDSVEITGQVVSVGHAADAPPKTSQDVAIAFDELTEESATLLEGFLLSTRSGGAAAFPG